MFNSAKTMVPFTTLYIFRHSYKEIEVPFKFFHSPRILSWMRLKSGGYASIDMSDTERSAATSYVFKIPLSAHDFTLK